MLASLVFAIIWLKVTSDKTIFLYIIPGILFWVMFGFVLIDSAKKVERY